MLIVSQKNVAHHGTHPGVLGHAGVCQLGHRKGKKFDEDLLSMLLGMDKSPSAETVRIVAEIHREDRQCFRDQEWTTLHSWCIG